MREKHRLPPAAALLALLIGCAAGDDLPAGTTRAGLPDLQVESISRALEDAGERLLPRLPVGPETEALEQALGALGRSLEGAPAELLAATARADSALLRVPADAPAELDAIRLLLLHVRDLASASERASPDSLPAPTR